MKISAAKPYEMQIRRSQSPLSNLHFIPLSKKDKILRTEINKFELDLPTVKRLFKKLIQKTASLIL